MADQDFDRTIFNLRERPVTVDMNQLQSQLDRTLRDLLRQMHGVRFSNASDLFVAGAPGFWGDAFSARESAPAGLTVDLRAGMGFQDSLGADVPADIDGVSGLDDLSSYKPLLLSGVQQITGIPASDPVDPRIDIIEVKYNRRRENPLSRDTLDPGTGVFTAGLVDKTLAFALDGTFSINGAAAINYKTGTPAAAPAVPATSAGYVKIAEVMRPTLSASVLQQHIRDMRVLLGPGNVYNFGFEFDIPITAGLAAPNNLAAFMLPPGVRVALVMRSVAGVRFVDIYIAMGSGPASFQASAHVNTMDGFGLVTQTTTCDVFSDLFDVTATEVTDIEAGANTALPFPIAGPRAGQPWPGAVGQRVARIRVCPHIINPGPAVDQAGLGANTRLSVAVSAHL